MANKIFIVDWKVPTPDQDSGSASTFSYLQILAAAGFDITFLAFDRGDGGHYADAVRALGVTIVDGQAYVSREQAVERLAPEADLVILYRAHIAHQLFDIVRASAPEAKILFHAVDLHHLRTQRGGELANDPAAMREAEQLREIEIGLITRADATIVVSAFEHAMLCGLGYAAKVHFIPILRQATPPPARPGWPARLIAWLGRAPAVPSERRNIVFVGGFLHQPNGDGIRWFIEEVWPLVLSAGIDNRLVVAGSHLPPDIAALASDTVSVVGFVEDLAGLFADARLSIAPLRYGAGIKGKVVSSLSLGLPVVATRIAAEGTGLVDGKDILIADDAPEMARLIVELCRDDALWWRLSLAGHDTFMKTFSHDAGAPKILGVVNSLLADTKSVQPSS